MEIRPATLVDLNKCLALDDTYETDYVWQMEERADPRNITVNLRLTRLPRPMKLRDAVSRDRMAFNYQHGGNLWVCDDGVICGFIDGTLDEWNQSIHINALTIAPAYRRKGLGTQLLQTALDWAQQQKLSSALLDTSTKNYPAMCFFQKQGFAFCGFNDRLYPNRDIAMLFALNLR